MFPDKKKKKSYAAGSSPHKLATCAAWHRGTTGKCHRCQRRFTVTAVRSAFPWLPRNANGKTLPWKNGKKKTAPDPFSDGWLVGWKSRALPKEIPYMLQNIAPINFSKPRLVLKWNAAVCRQWLCTNEGKSESVLLISAARASCHKPVILRRAHFQHTCGPLESLAAPGSKHVTQKESEWNDEWKNRRWLCHT